MTLLSKTTISSVTGPLPIDLQSARQKLGEATGDLDSEILISLEAATRFCEEATGRILRESAIVVETYPAWPGSAIGFNYNPVLSIESLTYYQADLPATIPSSDYTLAKSTNLGACLNFDSDFTPPKMDTRADAFRVVYKSGYGEDPIDPRAKQAILLRLPLYFDGAAGQDYTNTTKMADALLEQLRWQLYQ